MDNAKVLERAAKFLAMQEHRGATEAEAANAAEHLQRLLQEHNLTLSEVEAHQDGSSTATVKRTKDVLKTAVSRSRQWQKTLIEGIARNNFCLAWPRINRGDEKREQHITLVGREVNVTVTKMTYDYLSAALLRAMHDHEIGDRRNYVYFMDGAVSRVIDRLNKRRLEAERENAAQHKGDGSGRALVLSDVYGTEADLNNDHLNGFPAGTTAARRREASSREAAREVREQELVKEGVDPTEAFYLAHGYGAENAKVYAAEHKRRVRRLGRSRGRSQDWTRSDEAQYRKVNSTAYKQGLEAGSTISLDAQVGNTERKRLGRS